MDIAAIQILMNEAFLVEAADLLTELDASMLELETRPEDTELLNRVFRAIHTIKGSGATAGFTEMAAFTHHVEELFDEARMARLTITPEMIDLALRAKDLIGLFIEPEPPTALASACREVVLELAKFLPHDSLAVRGSETTATANSIQPQLHRIYFKPHSQVFFSGTDPINLVDELRALGESTVTAQLKDVPSLENLKPEQCYLAWDVTLLGAGLQAKIKEVFLFVEDESEITIEVVPVAQSGDASLTPTVITFLNIADQCLAALGVFLAEMESAGIMDANGCKGYLRTLKMFLVAVNHQGLNAVATMLQTQIDSFPADVAEQASEPDLTYAKFTHKRKSLGDLIQGFRASAGDESQPVAQADESTEDTLLPVAVEGTARKDSPKAATSIRVDQEKLDRLMRIAGELLVARNAFPILAKRLVVEYNLGGMGKEVKDAGTHISRITEDLQAVVMQIRMTPIRTVFQRFPRMVRDIARALGKEVDVVMEGEDTELDRTVIEQIADPLVHLVRNAADHGIERPENREHVGKSRAGKVTLRAYKKENSIVLEVIDDGHGMDAARLRSKALEKGLITRAAAEAMDDRAALDLVFLPGLSTADKVTDISGRGVGMDVVRSNIRQLHGTITLDSRLGLGSKITISLPASLMVTKGILVESNREQYILPMESVIEIVRLPLTQLHCHGDQRFICVRNEVFSVLRLDAYFGPNDDDSLRPWPAEVLMAIIQAERMRMAVMVDPFLGDVEVIVKPIGQGLSQLQAYRGATIMGDGRVVLVLNPNGLA